MTPAHAYTPTDRDPAGVWNAYVAAGDTRDERRARLAQAPEPLRAGIEAHVRTVFALKTQGAKHASQTAG